MSKITISQLQTEENLLIDLQAIDAHNVMGGKKYYNDDHDGYGDRGKGHGRGHGYGYGHGGGGYCPSYH
jgi:hypothetical protein